MAHSNAMAVRRAEATDDPLVLDRGLERADAPLELAFLVAVKRCTRGSGESSSSSGRGRGQGVEGRLDLRVLVGGREGELLKRGVAVGCR